MVGYYECVCVCVCVITFWTAVWEKPIALSSSCHSWKHWVNKAARSKTQTLASHKHLRSHMHADLSFYNYAMNYSLCNHFVHSLQLQLLFQYCKTKKFPFGFRKLLFCVLKLQVLSIITAITQCLYDLVLLSHKMSLIRFPDQQMKGDSEYE